MSDLPNGCQGKDCLDRREAVVWIQANHSLTRKGRQKRITVDTCIADMVEKLYPLTAASCCGHEQEDGRILLYDGRVLRIYKNRDVEGAMPEGAWGYADLTEENNSPGEAFGYERPGSDEVADPQ